MSRRCSTIFRGMAAVATLVVLSAIGTEAQVSPPVDQAADQGSILQDLLEEVRSLRAAIEHMILAAYRAEIAIERLRLQQERVGTLGRELESVKTEIAESESRRPILEKMIEQLEERKRTGQIDDIESRMMEARVEQEREREKRLREREARLAGQLETERLNLSDINYRLDGLEKELESPPDDRGRRK